MNRDTFVSLYGEFTDPRTGDHLGAPSRDPAEVQRRFAEKKAGRTGLTRDEERQLWAEARAEETGRERFTNPAEWVGVTTGR